MRNRFEPAAAPRKQDAEANSLGFGERVKSMSRNMLNGAQVIVDYLIQEKVPQVFGLCGHGNIQFIDALYERSDELKTISVHHESVAGFMADVYYRVSGRPTATFTSCGPGSANLPISLGKTGDQIFFGCEVEIKGAGGDARLAADVLHAGGMKA